MTFLSDYAFFNATELNETSIVPLAESPTGLFELPTGPLGVLLFLVSGAIATFATIGYCYLPEWNPVRSSRPGKDAEKRAAAAPVALSAALALLLFSLPAGNLLWVAGDHLYGNALGLLQLGLLLVALGLSAQMACEATEEKDTVEIIVKPCSRREGEEYPFEYIGCMNCEKPLSKSYFFSCETCTQQRINCTVSYELCRKCVLEHASSHDVMQWELNKCVGHVDYEAMYAVASSYESEDAGQLIEGLSSAQSSAAANRRVVSGVNTAESMASGIRRPVSEILNAESMASASRRQVSGIHTAESMASAM